MEINLEPLMDPQELAKYLNCGMNSAYKLLQEGQIKAFRVGKSWKIPKCAVDEFIYRQTCSEAQRIEEKKKDAINFVDDNGNEVSQWEKQ